jgi:hypothetical protein
MDIYQGRIGTISPAMGNYDIEVYLNIDKSSASTPTGTATGIWGQTGCGTLEPTYWAMGVTGINSANFTNAKHGF